MRKLLLFLLAFAPLAHAAPAYVASSGYFCTSGASVASQTCAFQITVPAGALLVAAVNVPNTSGDAYTITASDNINGAWAQGLSCFNAYVAQANLFYLPNSGAGTVTLTVASATAVIQGVAIAAYSGVATSSPVDVAASCNTAYSSTTITAPNVSTLNANDLIVNTSGWGSQAGPNVSVSSPYTLRYGGNYSSMIADQIAASVGSVTGGTFTATTGNNPTAMSVAFKASGGGGGGSTAAQQVGAFLSGAL